MAKKITLRYFRYVLLLLILMAGVGCVTNSALLETTVNDPIMLDLEDWDDDLAVVEDGGGSSGSSMSCYS